MSKICLKELVHVIMEVGETSLSARSTALGREELKLCSSLKADSYSFISLFLGEFSLVLLWP